MKNVIITGLVVTVAASIAGNVLLYQRYSTNRPLVRIGNDVITKKQYQDTVDYQTQGGILKKMVLADLINQAAAKAGVTPKPSDVDDRIAMIQRINPQMLQATLNDAAKLAEVRDELKTNIALENLQVQGISVTDAEVAKFYNDHKQAFARPNQILMTWVLTENDVDASTAAALLTQNTPIDVISRQPRLHVVGMNGFSINFNALPPTVAQSIKDQITGMKPGSVKRIAVGQQFIVVKAQPNTAPGTPPLSDIRSQVVKAAKLAKAPNQTQELAKLYHDGNVSFEVDKYAGYFDDVQNAAQTPPDKKTASSR